MGLFDMIGSITGSVLDYEGTKKQNKTQKKVAREQMDFQREMSNTAYQRAVKDMQAAGLSPILAYSQGGASTPGGAMPQIQNEMGAAVSGAQAGAQVMQAISSLDVNDATADNLRATADKTRAEQMSREMATAQQMADLKKREGEAGITEVMRWLQEGTREWAAKSIMAKADIDEFEARAKEKTFAEDVAKRKAESTLTQLEVPESQARAGMYKDLGKMAPELKFLMELFRGFGGGHLRR